MQPQKLSEVIGQNIRRRRDELKMTQAELAGAVGVAQGYISDLEAGKRTPRVGRIANIAEVLTVPPSYLMSTEHLATI